MWEKKVVKIDTWRKLTKMNFKSTHTHTYNERFSCLYFVSQMVPFLWTVNLFYMRFFLKKKPQVFPSHCHQNSKCVDSTLLNRESDLYIFSYYYFCLGLYLFLYRKSILSICILISTMLLSVLVCLTICFLDSNPH